MQPHQPFVVDWCIQFAIQGCEHVLLLALSPPSPPPPSFLHLHPTCPLYAFGVSTFCPPPPHIYIYLSIYLLIYLSICRMLPLLLHSPLIIFHYLFFSLKYIPSFQTVLSIASKPPDLDLPGMGKNFCIACNRYVVLYYAVFAVGHYSSVDNDNSVLRIDVGVSPSSRLLGYTGMFLSGLIAALCMRIRFQPNVCMPRWHVQFRWRQTPSLKAYDWPQCTHCPFEDKGS